MAQTSLDETCSSCAPESKTFRNVHPKRSGCIFCSVALKAYASSPATFTLPRARCRAYTSGDFENYVSCPQPQIVLGTWKYETEHCFNCAYWHLFLWIHWIIWSHHLTLCWRNEDSKLAIKNILLSCLFFFDRKKSLSLINIILLWYSKEVHKFLYNCVKQVLHFFTIFIFSSNEFELENLIYFFLFSILTGKFLWWHL